MGSSLEASVSESVIQLQTPGLVGYFSPASCETDGSLNLKKMLAAFNSSLKSTKIILPGYSCASTGDYCPLGEHGHVFLAGHPNFVNKELACLAATEGSAAALAKAYTISENDFIKHIGGDFSFCIINVKSNRLIVGIDRLGQQPLYYTELDGGIAWGTTANSVLAHSECATELMTQGIYNYAYFHMVPCPNTIFKGLKKLPAAHYLVYENGKAEVARYWQPRFREKHRRSFKEFSDDLRPTLQNAVNRAIGSEKNVGAFLSGGLDSSTVAGMLAQVSGGQAKAFSIGFAAEGYDEMPYARLAAQHFGIKLYEYYVTPDDVVDALPMVATCYDEPFGNSSALPAYFCARLAAKNGIKRLLAGDGGDEIFAGNERYARQKIFDRYLSTPSALRRNFVEPLLRVLPHSLPLVTKARSYIEQANTQLPDRLQSYNFLHKNNPVEIFTDDFLAEVRTEEPLVLQRDIFNFPKDADQLDRMLYLDWQLTLADNDLRKVSHMCSLAGVDVVYPMLDDELVLLSCELPSQLKLKGGELRHFYKEALRGWLPTETIEKRKQGFGLPFGVWMRTHPALQEMAYDNIVKLKSRGIFKGAFLDNAIALHRDEHAAYFGELIWILTVLELWMEQKL